MFKKAGASALAFVEKIHLPCWRGANLFSDMRQSLPFNMQELFAKTAALRWGMSARRMIHFPYPLTAWMTTQGQEYSFMFMLAPSPHGMIFVIMQNSF